MVGDVMLMTGLSYAGEQLNSLPARNFWYALALLSVLVTSS
jgi:hypothetical protein